MLKILIVDDEPSAGNIVKLLIEKFISLEKEIQYCSSAETALDVIKSFQPSLVMLDIEMPNMSGFDFLIKAGEASFDVIFTTAYDKYAIKAIRFSALDYLLKPIDGLELQNAVNRHIIKQQTRQPGQQSLVSNLISNLKKGEQENFKLALSTVEGVSFFDPVNILYCEGENNYTRFIFLNHKPILISKTLGEYEEILEDYNFTRIHKSYLVNNKYIMHLSKDGTILMSDGKQLPVSRRRKIFLAGLLMNK